MTHAIIAATGLIDEALKAVSDTNPTFMSTSDKADALRELVRLESRVAELRLRVLADAADVAAGTGARDAADWLADESRLRPEDARGRPAASPGASTDGGRHSAQPCARATSRRRRRGSSYAPSRSLPDEVPADVLDRAEDALVEHAARFAPRQLARIGRHVLAVVAPHIADAAEASGLAALEAEGRRRTRLTLPAPR